MSGGFDYVNVNAGGFEIKISVKVGGGIDFKSSGKNFARYVIIFGEGEGKAIVLYTLDEETGEATQSFPLASFQLTQPTEFKITVIGEQAEVYYKEYLLSSFADAGIPNMNQVSGSAFGIAGGEVRLLQLTKKTEDINKPAKNGGRQKLRDTASSSTTFWTWWVILLVTLAAVLVVAAIIGCAIALSPKNIKKMDERKSFETQPFTRLQ